MKKTPAEMTQKERAEVMLKFKKLADFEKLVRAEYLKEFAETGEGHEMIEVCEGRIAKSYDPEQVENVLEILYEFATDEDFLLSDFVQLRPVTKLVPLLHKLCGEDSIFAESAADVLAAVNNAVVEKTGESFTRLKPQKDPELFRD